MVTDEIEGEAASDRHVFGAKAVAVARKIVFEDDVEKPGYGRYSPAAPRTVSQP